MEASLPKLSSPLGRGGINEVALTLETGSSGSVQGSDGFVSSSCIFPLVLMTCCKLNRCLVNF